MSHDTPPPGGPTAPMPGIPNPDAKGFFGALFDFSFEHFVTPMIVKVVYLLAILALAVAFIVWLVIGFSQGIGYGLGVLVLGSIGFLLYLCLIRMTLEFYLAITRMSQDIHQRLR